MALTDFITKADYLYQIKTYKLDQITEATDTMLDSVEDEAIGLVLELLSGRYDMNNEFGKSGANRNKALLRWVKCLVMYMLYERIPDALVPERVIKNYDDTMEMLNKISDGKMNCTLAQLSESDANGNNEPFTKTRWGSQQQRSQGDSFIDPNKFGVW